MENELLDVVKHATAFANGGDDGVELVIGEHNLGGRLGDIGSGTHGDTDVSAGQGGSIIDTVTSHGHEGTAAAESVNHSGLGIGGTTGNDEGKLFHGVNLVFGHSIKVGGLLDNGLGNVIREDAKVLGNDADFLGDGLGGLGVVTSKHVDADTSSRALGNGGLGLTTGRIVDTRETKEDEVLFDLVSELLVFARGRGLLGDEATIPGAVGDGEDTLTLRSEVVHLSEDVLLELGSHDLLLFKGTEVGAEIEDTLDGTLGEDHGVVSLNDGTRLALGGIVDNGHALDGAVKGELGHLLPAVALEGFLSKVESVGKDLEGDFSGLTSCLPLLVFVIVSDSGQVAESGGQEERLELIGHLAISLGDGGLGGLVVLVELLIGDVKLEDGSRALAVVVAGLLLLGLLVLGLGVGDSALGGIGRALGVADGVDVGGGDPGLADNHGTFGEGTGLVGANVGDTTEGLEGGEISDDDVGLSHDGDGDDHGNGQDTGS